MEIKLFDEYYVYRAGVDEWELSQPEIKLFAGKNDEAICQLLIRPDDYATVSVGKAAAFSKYGMYENFRVAADCDAKEVKVSCKLVDKVPDDANVAVSDIVLESDYINCTRGIGQQVMIHVQIPENVKEGDYSVNIRIYRSKGFVSEELCEQFTVPLHVYPVTMPDVKDYRFHLDLWQHNANIARKSDVPIYSDAHFAVIEGYVKSLAALGQKAVSVIASEIPWSGQRAYRVSNYYSDLYEYSMIGVTKQGGKFHYDYSTMQRYIDLCFANGIDREIEVFGLINIWMEDAAGFGKAYEEDPDGVRVRYYDADKGIFSYMSSNAEIADYVAALEQYFINTDQIKYVQVVADEPAEIEVYRKSLMRLHEAAPQFAYKVAINHIEFIEEFGDYISDVVPAINYAAEKADYLAKRSESGLGRTLLYVCCGPDYPNTFLHSPAFEIEVITTLIHRMKLDGFLRWNYTVWPENPRERLSFRAPGWKAGDTNFVYPGHNGKPLLSLRWYHLKRAILQYELLTRMQEKGCTEQVEQVYRTILLTNDPADFTKTSYLQAGSKTAKELYAQETGCYLAARELMLQALI